MPQKASRKANNENSHYITQHHHIAEVELISVCRMSFSDQKCPTKTVKVAVQELFDEINLMLCGRIVHQTKSGKVPTNKISWKTYYGLKH